MNMYINDLANFHGFQLASERESRSTSSTMGMCSTRNRNSIEFQLGWGPQITKTLQVMWGNLPTRNVHIQTQYHTFFFRYFKEVISLCLDTRLFAFASGSYLASFEIRQEIHELMLVNSRRGCKVVRLKCPELSAPGDRHSRGPLLLRRRSLHFWPRRRGLGSLFGFGRCRIPHSQTPKYIQIYQIYRGSDFLYL